MRRTLQLLALMMALGATGTWLATGANRGWTKTSLPVKTVDEVTGIEGIRYERRFVPGLDFVGTAWLGAALLAGIACLFRKQTKP